MCGERFHRSPLFVPGVLNDLHFFFVACPEQTLSPKLVLEELKFNSVIGAVS